jgi:hypothetical protein
MEEFGFTGNSASRFAETKLARVSLTLLGTVDLPSNKVVDGASDMGVGRTLPVGVNLA